MKKIILCLLLLSLVSCSYDYDPWFRGVVAISSESVFSIDNELYLSTSSYLPVTIYNPNNYAITVTADGTDYTIAPLETQDLKEKVSKDSYSRIDRIIDVSVNFVYNDTKGDFVWLDINTARTPRK